jgi:GTP pyrophosphokinase
MLAKWIDSSKQEFVAELQLKGIDTIGLLKDITNIITDNMNVNMKSISFDTNSGIFNGKIKVVVKNNTVVNKLMDNLKKINGIDKVSRI